jgi:hypothetical protein
VSIAALTVYLMVNIGAAAVHHHRGTEIGPGKLPTAGDTRLQFQATNSPDDEDEEETCLLCSVLRLTQTLPASFHVETVTVQSGPAFSAAAVIQPHPLETATHSRAPPIA